MTAEQLLQEAIIGLQKQDLGVETRHLVDEAAQLLADGKDIEARALVEKAQAISSADIHAKPNGVMKVNGPVAAKRIDPTIAQISGRLAQGIANAFTEALEDLHLSLGAQVTGVVGSLENRLTEIARVAEERWDRVSASIASLQETDHAHRVEAEQFSRELETIFARVTVQEERFEALNRLAQDLSSKVASAGEEIDRHTDLFRSLQERQTHRAAAWNEALDAIAKLREPKMPASQANAAQSGPGAGMTTP